MVCLHIPPLHHPVKLYRFSAISMCCKTNPEIGSRFHRFLSRSLVWGGWVKKLPYLRRGRINTITRLYLIFNPYWNAVGVTKVITIGWRIRQTAIDLLFIIETCWFWTKGFWQDFEVGKKGLGGHIFPCRPFQTGSKDMERIQSKDLQRIQRLGNIIQCMV